MIKRLQTKLYTALRKIACLSQDELGTAAGLSRRTVQAIEKGKKLPSEEEEAALQAATHSTLVLVAEILCEEMSRILGLRVTVCADDGNPYRAATADGRMNQLLLAAKPIMPEDRWWAWKERESRRQTLGQVYEHEGCANVRDLKSEIEALQISQGELQAEKEAAEEPEEQ